MRNHRVLLVVIVIIATFLRLYHFIPANFVASGQVPSTEQNLLPPGLYPDEAMNGNNALEAIHTGLLAGGYKLYYPENNGREGLFMNIQSLFIHATGILEPWALRLPSPFIGILTVIGLYFLGKELISREAGLLAAFFLATNFWHINFSRIGFRAIMAPFFLVWAVALLLVIIRKVRETRSLLPSIYYLLFLGGIIYGLGFYSYIAYRVSPILIFFILIYYWMQSRREGWQRPFIRAACLFLLITFFTALPIGIYYLKNPADFLGRTSQLSVFSSATPLHDLGNNIVKTLGMFNVAGDGNWRHNYSGRPELFWPVGILFLIGIVVSVGQIIRKKHSSLSALTIFMWFGLAALPVVISNEGIPHALRSILLIPPAMLFAAVGGTWLYEKAKNGEWKMENGTKKIVLFSLCSFLFALLTFEAYHTYFILWGQNPNVAGAFNANYVELARQLNALPVSEPKYVVVEAGGVLARGIPMPSQTVMFMTDTYLPEGQQAKNIHYVLPENEKDIPPGAMTFYIR